MENENLTEKDKVSPPTAEEMEGDQVDPEREPQGERANLNSSDETQKLNNENVGEGLDAQTINNEKNHNLHHDKVVESSDDEISQTLEQRPEEVQSSNIVHEENHNLHHDRVEGSDDQQTTENSKLKPEEVQSSNINDEENHNLHHEKIEDSDDQKTSETSELKPKEVQSSKIVDKENLNLHHDRVEGPDDQQTAETLELKHEEVQCSNINDEENHNLHHAKIEGLDDQKTSETSELKPEEVNIVDDEKHNLHPDRVDGLDDQQTTENLELKIEEVLSSNINDEENHNLHHEKIEDSDDQKISETSELKPEEVQSSNIVDEKNHNLHHDRVEGSDDQQTAETLELKQEEVQSSNINDEENLNLHRIKVEDSDDQRTSELKPEEVQSSNISTENPILQHDEVGESSNAQNHSLHDEVIGEGSGDRTVDILGLKLENQDETDQGMDDNIEEKVVDPVFDGTEIPEVEDTRSSSTRSLDLDQEVQGSALTDKAVSLKKFVKEKSTVAVSSVLRRFSGKKAEDEQNLPECQEKNDNSSISVKDEEDSTTYSKSKEVSQKMVDRSMWNPLSYVRITRDADSESTGDQGEAACTENSLQTPVLKGRIMLYTRLGCPDCRGVRSFLHQRKLRYVEINIDVYPGRKLELERLTGSPAVPIVFFNDLPIGGLSKLKDMDETGELKDKINELISEEASPKVPLPPLSGEDDESCSGAIDELATIAKKMRHSILIKDRFCRMRRYSNCFLGSEAVDFLVEDQELQREQALEIGRKLASKQFFRQILDENFFEDGNYLYRFLDHDPVVMSQCYNIPRGIIEAKPRSLMEISSRLRFLSIAIFEAYTSEDGKHVDYRSIHGSEEFARYLRVVEELQRVEMQNLSREEKLAFFTNLYNMMAIHAIMAWGYPVGALERRKMLGDFKYVIGGCTYSLSAIQNGILRGNQRPPYNLVKPFGVKDQRAKIALPYPEPLIHFALVIGTRSGPALRCFSPGNIDKELMEAARNFLRNGGVIVSPEAKVASVSKILKWYSVDFGKNDVEVLKHAANYLEPDKCEELLELLANTQLKVAYQPYDWGLNC